MCTMLSGLMWSGKVWRDEAVPGKAWQGTGNSR